MWIALRPSGPSDLKNRQPKTVAASSPRTSIADSSHKQAAAAPVNEAAPAPRSVVPPTPPGLSDSAQADTSPTGGSLGTAVDDADSRRRDDGKYLDLVVAPGVTMRLVKIPASADDKIKSFYLGQTEVTEAQWAVVMGGQSEHPSLPRVGMTFNDCKNFLHKVGEASSMQFRLRPLTKGEAQFVTGDESKYGLDAMWCLENSQRQPRAVATAKPNEYALFDIVGNAWEFCEGGFIYGTCFTTPHDQRGFRIHMPGNGDPNFKAPDVGFRIAADLLTTPSEERTGFRVSADIPAREPGEKTSTAEVSRAESPVGGHSELKKRQFDDRMAAVKAQASAARSADEFGSLALEYASLVTLAVELDDYERANRLAATMVRDARKTRDRGLQDDMRLRAKQAQEMRSAFNQAKPALTALEADPASADANAAWGRYVAWVKDNWHDGLPLLARGGDEVAALATRELDEPKSPEAKVVLADDWWETARREKGQVQRTIEEHACRWYEQAASELAPADRQAVLKKIERSFGDSAIHELDATGSRIELGGAEANVGPEATLEFWVCTKARDVPLFTKRQRRDDQSLTFYMSGGNINLVSDGPDHRIDIWDAASAPIDDDRWHHLAAVKRGKSLSVMVDGRLAGTGEGLEFYRSESAWILGVHRPWNNSHGQGRFCRLRLSTIARYHPPFKPNRTYERDQYTAWMR
jgi:hypothetical protein